jgi:hypothetical protein
MYALYANHSVSNQPKKVHCRYLDNVAQPVPNSIPIVKLSKPTVGRLLRTKYYNRYMQRVRLSYDRTRPGRSDTENPCLPSTDGHGRYSLVRDLSERKSPTVFFRQTLKRIHGLHDREQKHWDMWISLRQGAAQDIAEYNVEFQQALIDLASSIANEQVKIEKYCSGLQYDLRELCRTSPTGARWACLTDIV